MKRINLYTIFVLASIVAALAVTGVGVKKILAFYRKALPDVSILNSKYPVVVRKEEKTTVYEFQSKKPAQWMRLNQVPKSVVAAIILSEDGTFFQHKGYSTEAIWAAVEYNAKPGIKFKRGGSTITQQVVKNLFLTREKTITRKVRELLLSVDMERQFSKAKILEFYINIAEWGPGVYGIERASQKYFQKSAANLTPRDAATLAFMLPNPTKYRYSIGAGRDGELTSFAEKRVESILERMLKTGYISPDEYNSSTNSPIVPSTLYSNPQDELSL